MLYNNVARFSLGFNGIAETRYAGLLAKSYHTILQILILKI